MDRTIIDWRKHSKIKNDVRLSTLKEEDSTASIQIKNFENEFKKFSLWPVYFYYKINMGENNDFLSELFRNLKREFFIKIHDDKIRQNYNFSIKSVLFTLVSKTSEYAGVKILLDLNIHNQDLSFLSTLENVFPNNQFEYFEDLKTVKFIISHNLKMNQQKLHKINDLKRNLEVF